MIIGCVLLILVWKRYDFKTKAAFAPASPSAPVALVQRPEKNFSVRL
jgi:hypothetical protein